MEQIDYTRLDEQLAKLRGNYETLPPPERERVHKGLDSLIAVSSDLDESELKKSRERLLHWGNVRYHQFPDTEGFNFEQYTARNNQDPATRDEFRASLTLERQGIFLRDKDSPGQTYVLTHPDIERAALNSLETGFIYDAPPPSSDERFHVKIVKPAIFGIVKDQPAIIKKGKAEVRPASRNQEGWKWGCK